MVSSTLCRFQEEDQMELLDLSELTDAVSVESQRSDPFMYDMIDRIRECDVPIEMTDLDVWSNYLNEQLYFMDKKVREFLKRTRYKRMVKDGYKTTSSIVFAWIYGRQPTPADGATCRMLNTLLKYYCTSYGGRTTFNGKPVYRVYHFSKFACNEKRPYSLKLRMEEANGTSNVFRAGPNHNVSKRTHGRRTDREDGKCEVERRCEGCGGDET